jgi:hypothetical protein
MAAQKHTRKTSSTRVPLLLRNLCHLWIAFLFSAIRFQFQRFVLHPLFRMNGSTNTFGARQTRSARAEWCEKTLENFQKSAWFDPENSKQRK